MKHPLTYFILIVLASCHMLFACDDAVEKSATYPLPANHVDREIDALLYNAEESLFAGEFKNALADVDRVEILLPLTVDENDHRTLRSLFDKAVIVTCIEGPTDNSSSQFSKFNALLASKSCTQNANKSQPNLFDQNGHWPIIGDGPVSIKECLDRVDNTEKALQIACAGLQVNHATRMAIETALYAIGSQAKRCCTEHGFWKTCIQPVVDTWKRAELLGIPPDPYWD